MPSSAWMESWCLPTSVKNGYSQELHFVVERQIIPKLTMSRIISDGDSEFLGGNKGR